MVLGLGGSSSSKASFSALPRTVSSITISVGGLALFLIFGSWLLISSPLGSTVIQVYFFRNAPTTTTTTTIPVDQSITTPTTTTTTTIPIDQSITTELIQQSPPPEVPSHIDPVGSKVVDSVADDPKLNPVPDIPDINITSTVTAPQEQDSANNSQTSLPSSHVYPNTTMVDSGGCDLYHGKWFYDSSGPLYTNNTCPVLTQMQNCQGNGRPDKDYENWRWKPSGCDLPRFDPKKFLELMRGKTLAFIGDSVARNQMESMICILWQVEVPKNRGNKRMQRWFFRSTNTMIVRIWSSWLVHQSPDAIDFAPPGVVKLHLDQPDDGFMDVLPSFDVVVLSSGHWFAKQSVYVLNNEIVGGQLWWPDKTRQMKVNNIDAFGISVETIMTAIGNHPNFTGITIVRSFSPDHYEGGAWNTGGSCTGKSSPAAELVENGFTNVMHEKQVNGFNEAVKKVVNSNGSKLRLMDITEAFSYRHDGHPGPYRSPDPNKVTKRGPHGEPPPQDCLHWCMPGPVDTWNEIVLEIIRREFEGVDSGSSSSLL